MHGSNRAVVAVGIEFGTDITVRYMGWILKLVTLPCRFGSRDLIKFKDLGLSAHMVGTDTSPDRQTRKNRDVEVSKKVENIAKKHFLQKNTFFRGMILGRYTSFPA